MQKSKKWVICLLALLLTFMAMPQNVAQAADYSTITVRLDSMNKPTSVNFRVEGTYSIDTAPGVTLVAGTNYLVTAGDNQLYIWINGVATALGNSFTFRTAQANYTLGLGLLISNTSYGSIRYLGDMKVTASGGTMTLYNTLPMETYLYGVVAHEMSNDWPLEALKAQAVAARTYAILRASSLGDTTSYQVYKGYNRNHTNVIQAVNDTAGNVLTYQGVLAQAYYAASNGGVTETATAAWGKPVAYTVVKNDPYDLRNPSSVVNTLVLKNTGAGPISALYSTNIYSGNCPMYNVYSYIKQHATAIAAVNNLGAFEITAINNLRVAQGSAVGTVLTNPVNLNTNYADYYLLLDVQLTGATTINTTISFFHRELEILNKGLSTRLLTLSQGSDGSFMMTNRRYGHGVGMSQRGAQEMAKDNIGWRQILEFYYPGTALIQYNTGTTLQLPTTTVPEDAGTGGDIPFAPVINSNEATVTAATSLYSGPGTQYAARATLTVGTKVTVNEWGQWSRIYTGTMEGYVLQSNLNWPNAPTIAGTPVPSTPVPTTAPIATPPPAATTTATINVTGTLNLRGGPGTTYPILASMPRGATVTVLESGAWCKIVYNNITGYVMSQYLITGTSAPTTTTPAATGNKMVVNTQSGRLNVRSGPGSTYAVVGSLARGETVTVLASGTWTKIQAGNLTGYVTASYLVSSGSTTTGSTTGSTGVTGTIAKTGTVTATSLSVRSAPNATSPVLVYLSKGTVINIYGTTGNWYIVNHNGKTAYVHMNYVK